MSTRVFGLYPRVPTPILATPSFESDFHHAREDRRSVYVLGGHRRGPLVAGSWVAELPCLSFKERPSEQMGLRSRPYFALQV